MFSTDVVRESSPRTVRTLATLLAAALTMAAPLAMTSAHAATPTAKTSMTNATAVWKISDCAFSNCMSLTEAHAVTGSVAKADDGWHFSEGTGTFDAATGETTVAFTGSVTLGNNSMGGYRIVFADPEVTIGVDGKGTVIADLSFRTFAGAPMTTVNDVELVSLAGVPKASSWTVTPPWAGVGTPGANNTAPVNGEQFAQPLLNALPDSLKGWFLNTGAGTLNVFKAPSPLMVTMPEGASAQQASVTKVTLSATKVRAGMRPSAAVTVTVAGKSATGTVAVRVDGRTVRGTLKKGKATLRLPSATSVGRHVVTATFAGTDAVKPSSGKATLQVVKR